MRADQLAALCIALLAGCSATAAEPVPDDDRILLCWRAPTENVDGSALTDLAGYSFYWGVNSRAYDAKHTLNDPAATCWLMPGLAAGYYFVAMKAFDAEGNESAFSNEVLKTSTLGVEVPGGTALFASWEYLVSDDLYHLPARSFNGAEHVYAGIWSVPGQSLDITANVVWEADTGDARVISKAVGTAEQDHDFMLSTRLGKARFRLKTGGVTSTLIGATDLPLNQPIELRATYDGSEMRLYVDGQLDASMPKTGDMDQSDASVWVGANPPDGAGGWVGEIEVTVRN